MLKQEFASQASADDAAGPRDQNGHGRIRCSVKMERLAGSRCSATNGENRAASGLSGRFDARPCISAQFSQPDPDSRAGTGADHIGSSPASPGRFVEVGYRSTDGRGRSAGTRLYVKG